MLGLCFGVLLLSRAGTHTTPLRVVVFGLLAAFGFGLLASDYKTLGLASFIVAAVGNYRYLSGRTAKRSLVVLWSSFVLLSLMPIDMALANYPGPPHLIRVACGGDFSLEGLRAGMAGEFMIDGISGVCSSLNDYTWILVW